MISVGEHQGRAHDRGLSRRGSRSEHNPRRPVRGPTPPRQEAIVDAFACGPLNLLGGCVAIVDRVLEGGDEQAMKFGVVGCLHVSQLELPGRARHAPFHPETNRRDLVPRCNVSVPVPVLVLPPGFPGQ